MSLIDLCAEADTVRAEIRAEQDRHLVEQKRLMDRLSEISNSISLLRSDVDLEKVRVAEQVLEITGTYARAWAEEARNAAALANQRSGSNG